MLTLKNSSTPAGPRPLRKYTFEERYKQFRNLLRRYSLESIVYEAIQHTATPPEDMVEALQQAPWLAMLIAKWALIDKMVPAGHGPAITAREFEGLMQQLWSIEGDLHAQSPGSGMHLMLRRITAVQVAFQAVNTRSFLRIPMLLARCPENHSLRTLFHEQWGMSPDHFVDLAICLYSARQHLHDPVIVRSAFAPLEAYYGAEAISRMLAEFSRSVSGLRTELIAVETGSDGKTKPRRRSELNEFPVFQWFPLIVRSDEKYVVWHPKVMAKALEMAVHLRLSKAGQAYIDAFSPVFEGYVIELAASLDGPCHTESDMQAQLGNKSKVVEALLSFAEANVMIEAKMGLFPDTMMSLSDPVIAGHKLTNLVKAVMQGAAVCEALHTGRLAFADTKPSETNYLLVITSRDLSIGRASMLDSMCQPKGVRYDSELGKQLLPLEHIFYVSVEAFEAIVAAVRLGKITLPEFLAHAVTRNRDPQTSNLWLDLQLPNGARNVDDPESAIAQAWEAASRRLEHALDAPGLDPFELKTA